MAELMPIGKRIRNLLRERGIPQIRFEEETGVSRRVLYGDHWIRRSTWKRQFLRTFLGGR